MRDLTSEKHKLVIPPIQTAVNILAQNCTVPTLSNGNVIWDRKGVIPKVVPKGSTIYIKCNVGYTLNMESALSCEDGGRWNNSQQPTCSGKIHVLL